MLLKQKRGFSRKKIKDMNLIKEWKCFNHRWIIISIMRNIVLAIPRGFIAVIESNDQKDGNF